MITMEISGNKQTTSFPTAITMLATALAQGAAAVITEHGCQFDGHHKQITLAFYDIHERTTAHALIVLMSSNRALQQIALRMFASEQQWEPSLDALIMAALAGTTKSEQWVRALLISLAAKNDTAAVVKCESDECLERVESGLWRNYP